MIEFDDLSEMKIEQGEAVRKEIKLKADLDVGKNLQARLTTQEGVEPLTVLDTGAGVSIAGEGLKAKFDMAGIPRIRIKPISLKISGVNSNAPVQVVGLIRVPLRFKGNPDVDISLAVVLVRQWKGDLLLSWQTLRRMGFTFRLDGDDTPVAACFKRLGVEVPLQEGDGPNTRIAREIGTRVDKAIYEREVGLIQDQVRLRIKKEPGAKASKEQIQRIKNLRKDLGINKADLCRERS
jgi:hypothetical protein